MAISQFPQIINHTFDLYSVPISSNAPDVASKVALGCLEEGFTIGYQVSTEDVKTECLAETVVDGVYTGIENAYIEGILQEWDKNRTAIEAIIWPEGSFGDLQDIGKMVSWSNLTTCLMAEPRTGTPAATNTLRWFFYATYPEKGHDFASAFNFRPQALPFRFKCYPIASEDNISNNKIYFNDVDTSNVTGFAADYTMRFWRRQATA